MRVLDQRGDLSEIALPTGRAAFMERLNAVLGARADAAAAAAAEGAARALSAVEQLRDDLVVAHGATLRRVFVRDGDETRRCWWCSPWRPRVSPRKNAASANPRR